jgi:hypothetical protein
MILLKEKAASKDAAFFIIYSRLDPGLVFTLKNRIFT